MADFTIRVELHYATPQDYANLASYLANVGITDIITGDDRTRYKMPPGEYNYSGNATLQQVFEATNTAANRVGKKYAVLISQTTGRIWIGLQAV